MMMMMMPISLHHLWKQCFLVRHIECDICMYIFSINRNRIFFFFITSDWDSFECL